MPRGAVAVGEGSMGGVVLVCSPNVRSSHTAHIDLFSLANSNPIFSTPHSPRARPGRGYCLPRPRHVRHLCLSRQGGSAVSDTGGAGGPLRGVDGGHG